MSVTYFVLLWVKFYYKTHQWEVLTISKWSMNKIDFKLINKFHWICIKNTSRIQLFRTISIIIIPCLDYHSSHIYTHTQMQVYLYICINLQVPSCFSAPLYGHPLLYEFYTNSLQFWSPFSLKSPPIRIWSLIKVTSKFHIVKPMASSQLSFYLTFLI